MQTTIIKWGNSQGIRLPKHILDSVNLSDGDAVEVYVDGDNIVIKKYCKVEEHKTIQELFAGYDNNYEPTEIKWGSPKGREIW
jgi:antitoxin MazE